MTEISDLQIREQLGAIDQDEDIEVSSFEAGFIESVCFKYLGPLSQKQHDCAVEIIEKYLPE